MKERINEFKNKNAAFFPAANATNCKMEEKTSRKTS